MYLHLVRREDPQRGGSYLHGEMIDCMEVSISLHRGGSLGEHASSHQDIVTEKVLPWITESFGKLKMVLRPTHLI